MLEGSPVSRFSYGKNFVLKLEHASQHPNLQKQWMCQNSTHVGFRACLQDQVEKVIGLLKKKKSINE